MIKGLKIIMGVTSARDCIRSSAYCSGTTSPIVEHKRRYVMLSGKRKVRRPALCVHQFLHEPFVHIGLGRIVGCALHIARHKRHALCAAPAVLVRLEFAELGKHLSKRVRVALLTSFRI